MRAIVLAAVLFAYASASAAQDLYLGTIGPDDTGDDVDLVLSIADDGAVTGASWWPREEPPKTWDMPLTTMRLVTGTREGKTLTLREWSDPVGPERSLIEVRFTSDGLRGTWRKHGNAPRPFEAWKAHQNESGLTAGGGAIANPSDRLHDAIRANNWPAAKYYAQLLCAVTTYACLGWAEAIPQLAAGRTPPRDPAAPWYGLVLEREGRALQAAALYREQCHARQYTSCAFLADLLPSLPPAQRRAGFELTCSIALIGCGEVFGEREAALTDAAHRGDVAAVVKLLRGPVNVNAGKAPFHTPLFAAVEARSLPIVILLLARGADPNLDGGYMAPVEFAIINHMDAIAKVLLHHGAKASSSQALWEAAYHRKMPLVRKILANGERPDDSLVPAGSPLTAAVDNGDEAMVRLLLAHGADPDITTNHSLGSPIDHARKAGKRKILRTLLAAKK